MDLLSTEEFIETKNKNYKLIKEVAKQLGILSWSMENSIFTIKVWMKVLMTKSFLVM